MTSARDERPERDRPRLTPYELVFGVDAFADERFPAILEEAEGRDVDTTVPAKFIMLATVAQLIEDILPEDAPGAAVEQYGRLLFHAVQFWRFDRYLLCLAEPLARRLVGDVASIGEWEIMPPHPAGYLQLPRHLFWSRIEPEATPEPVDGIFWSMVGRDDPAEPPYTRIDALLALGMRPERPGLSVVPVSEELPGDGPGHWGDADARPDGPDFGNILPGGELDELRALATPGEVLKLISRVFHYAAEHPGAVGEPESAGGGVAGPGATGEDGEAAASAGAAAPEDRGQPVAGGPPGHALPATGLAYRRLTGVEADG